MQRDSMASKRVSVMVGSRSVPLLPGRPVTDSERSPWSGLLLERHRVGAVEIPEHEHTTFCLHLQTSGPVAMDWHSSGRKGRVRTGAGDLIFLTPGTRDSLVWHGPSQRIVASVDPSFLRQAAEQIEVKGGCDFENCWSFQDEQVQLLLTEMDREMSDGWAMGSLYGDLLGMSLSIALVKKHGHLSAAPVRLRGGLSRPRLRQAMEYIDANLESNIRLNDLAELVGLSVYHFARSFRESLGRTPHQFILERRVERAKELLPRSEWTMEQIASAVGFGSASQFSKIFRSSTEATPSRWRRDG